LAETVENVKIRSVRKISQKSGFQVSLLLRAAAEHVRSPVVAFLLVDVVPHFDARQTRLGRANGLVPPAEKCFFDSIDPQETIPI
jgi:hypothetical protein